MGVAEVIGLYENVVDVPVSMDEHLNIDPRLACYSCDLFRRFAGTEPANDLCDNGLRNKSSVPDFRQKVPLPSKVHKTILDFFVDGKPECRMISEVISHYEEAR